MSWLILGAQVVAAVGMVVLAAGWWRLRRTIRELERMELLRDAAERHRRNVNS